LQVTAGPPTSLEKLIAENPTVDGLRVQLATSATVFDFSADGAGGEQLGRVKILDTYQEKYILARSIVNGIKAFTCRECGAIYNTNIGVKADSSEVICLLST